jgi:subtilisin family serine protease
MCDTGLAVTTGASDGGSMAASDSQNDAAWLSPSQAGSHLDIGSGEGIRVAVIDSGVEFSHPALKDLTIADDVVVMDDGLRLVARENTDGDAFGHGTAVAGIIHKFAPAAQIGSYRVLDSSNGSRSAIVCEAVRLALDAGYHIINCSFGCGVLDQVLAYKAWVDEAYLRGVHVVAACNNVDFLRPEWPGFFATVLTVNMARSTDEFRFWYKGGSLVEFAARGVNVEVPWKGGRTKVVTGSSYAAPRLSSMLARVLSCRPDLNPLQAKALFRAIADPWTHEIIGPNVTFSS